MRKKRARSMPPSMRKMMTRNKGYNPCTVIRRVLRVFRHRCNDSSPIMYVLYTHYKSKSESSESRPAVAVRMFFGASLPLTVPVVLAGRRVAD